MKFKLMIISSLFLALGIGAIIVFIPLKQEKDRLAQEATNAANTANSLKTQVADMQKTEKNQIETGKQAAQAEKKAGSVYFLAKSTPLSGGDTQIDIMLNGESNVLVDAVDLVLTHSPSVLIKKISKGTAFPSYPRLLTKNGSVTITGIAMPLGSSVTYGKVNEVLATIIVNKKLEEKLVVNPKDTQAYFNGAPILDFTRSFKEL